MDVVPRLIPKIFKIGGDAEIAAAHELKSRIHRCLLVVLFNFAKAHGWVAAFTANRRGRLGPCKVKERDVAIYTPPEGALVRRGGRGFCSLRRFARLRGRAAGRVAQGSRVGINQTSSAARSWFLLESRKPGASERSTWLRTLWLGLRLIAGRAARSSKPIRASAWRKCPLCPV